MFYWIEFSDPGFKFPLSGLCERRRKLYNSINDYIVFTTPHWILPSAPLWPPSAHMRGPCQSLLPDDVTATTQQWMAWWPETKKKDIIFIERDKKKKKLKKIYIQFVDNTIKLLVTRLATVVVHYELRKRRGISLTTR